MNGDLRNNMLKHFITHKRGETNADIQDSLSYDVSSGRYAISDGVTQSFLPQLWSKLLVEHFVSSSFSRFDISASLLEDFEKEKKKFVSNLNDEQKFLVELAEEEFQHAAATFAGVIVENKKVSWQVIGDSCVFIIPSSDKIQCICSKPCEIDSQGHIQIKFDNHPDYIVSDGTIKGNFQEGCITMEKGWILMMTDALSDWFIMQYNAGNNPLNKLLEIESPDEFEIFINNEYHAGRIKSDDTSMLLFNICDAIDTYDYELEWWEELPLWMM